MHNLSYFEAIIQLRPYNTEVLNFVKKKIEKRENVEISKEVKLKTGIDLYLTSQRFARALGKKLKKTFKGKLVLTRKLHTISKKTGKPLYRVTVLFRLA